MDPRIKELYIGILVWKERKKSVYIKWREALILMQPWKNNPKLLREWDYTSKRWSDGPHSVQDIRASAKV